MMRFAKSSVALLILLSSATAVWAQASTPGAEKVRLKHVFKAGAARKYKSEGTMSSEEGTEFSGDIKMENEDKLVKVGDDGNASYESKTLSIHISMNGNDMDLPEEQLPTIKSVLTPLNLLVSLETEEQMQDFERRVTLAWMVPFPDKELAVGDAWVHEFKADKAKGWRAGSSTDTLVAVETVDGVKCAKVQHKFTEKPFGGDVGSIKVTATIWIDMSNGELYKSTGDGTGMPMPGPGGAGMMKMSMKMSYVPAK